MTFPTTAQQNGDFSASGIAAIYDPYSQKECSLHTASGTAPCRYQYGYGYSGSGTSASGSPALMSGATANVIPNGTNGAKRWNGSTASEISPFTSAMQAMLPTTGIGTALQGNYVASNPTGLVNWSTTDRIDFLPVSSDTLTFIFADGRQASSVPVGQSTAGRNVAKVPYNFGQAYAPKTIVAIIEETHVFTPHLINQVKWGYARYNGPTFNPATATQYQPSHFGMSFANYSNATSTAVGGQAITTFPIVPFAGTNSPTGWGGSIANVTLAENYTAMDNLQWTTGKHNFTFGGQVAWLLYNTYSATGGTTPMVLASAVTETAALKNDGTTGVTSGTGMAYASFLLGQIDSAKGNNSSGSSFTYTDYSAHPGYGARFRPISPYIQDNWKIWLLRSQSYQPGNRSEWRLELCRAWHRHLQLRHACQELLPEHCAAPWNGLSAELQDRDPLQLGCHGYPWQRRGRPCLNSRNTGLLQRAVYVIGQRCNLHDRTAEFIRY
jgi:hypothetical protein